MSLNKIIKKIHLYIGLQATMALLIFSMTVLTFSTEESEESTVTHQKFSGNMNMQSLNLAIAVHEQIGLRFEAVPKRWMISIIGPDRLQIKFISPNGRRIIRLNTTNGDIEIKTRPVTFTQFINLMHQESFGRRQLTDSMWLWAWSVYIELSILALFVLPITGLYIWLSGKSEKTYWPKMSLLSSFITMVILWNLIR